jgi:hypothetical protein
MGKEAEVEARFGDVVESGRLQWEAPSLIFRGVTRRAWDASGLVGVTSDDGDLVLADGARFTLGAPQAARWAEAIANPPSRLDKLGVKPGQRIAVIQLNDPAFAHELAGRATPVPDRTDLDLIFTAADRRADLDRLEALIPMLGAKGAIWVVSRKGKDAGLRDVEVIRAARLFGLVDSKVCGFSDTHTALRFTLRRTS